MPLQKLLLATLLIFSTGLASAKGKAPTELDPFAPDVEEQLEAFDEAYEEQTGQSPFIDLFEGLFDEPTCYRNSCSVWVYVSKASQRLYLYLDGSQVYEWSVSTGVVGRGTPNFDRHPNGRIYDRYTSTAYPGGDYNGLGNMPYAVFIEGGFALHGTPRENWSKLGQRASHGCIRQHPDNARYLNRLIRRVGVRDVWVTVE